MKALICNGGYDLGTRTDYTYGFGWMNLLRSVDMLRIIISHLLYCYSGNNTHNITVPANTGSIEGMLYWNDPEAAALSARL